MNSQLSILGRLRWGEFADLTAKRGRQARLRCRPWLMRLPDFKNPHDADTRQ
jgi:hypothetical protein